jgi:hypothetical protein
MGLRGDKGEVLRLVGLRSPPGKTGRTSEQRQGFSLSPFNPLLLSFQIFLKEQVFPLGWEGLNTPGRSGVMQRWRKEGPWHLFSSSSHAFCCQSCGAKLLLVGMSENHSIRSLLGEVFFPLPQSRGRSGKLKGGKSPRKFDCRSRGGRAKPGECQDHQSRLKTRSDATTASLPVTP